MVPVCLLRRRACPWTRVAQPLRTWTCRRPLPHAWPVAVQLGLPGPCRQLVAIESFPRSHMRSVASPLSTKGACDGCRRCRDPRRWPACGADGSVGPRRSVSRGVGPRLHDVSAGLTRPPGRDAFLRSSRAPAHTGTVSRSHTRPTLSARCCRCGGPATLTTGKTRGTRTLAVMLHPPTRGERGKYARSQL
jgi:hypothetical protein